MILTPPNIRERREALGISRTYLAAQADCSPGSLQNIEGGIIPKRGMVLSRILDALDRLEKSPAQGEPVYSFVTELRIMHSATDQRTAEIWARRLASRLRQVTVLKITTTVKDY